MLNERVCGLLKLSIPVTGATAPPRLVSGSYPVYFVQVYRLRPATRMSTLLTPSVRVTHGASSVYVSEISRSFVKPPSSMHGSSTPLKGQAARPVPGLRYQFCPIVTAVPAPGPTTGPYHQPPCPNVFVAPRSSV